MGPSNIFLNSGSNMGIMWEHKPDNYVVVVELEHIEPIYWKQKRSSKTVNLFSTNFGVKLKNTLK